MIIAVYKPIGPSSRQMIDRIKRMTGIKKVGHAGTLDPLARGVLIVGVGREGTRQLTSIIKNEKEYVVTVRLGMTSTTDDEGGEKTLNGQAVAPTREAIDDALKPFLGVIQQVPPVYSAIKTHGSRAYRLARRGHNISLQAREVEIKSIEVLSYAWPFLKLRVTTGSGAYVRALARDLGTALGTGGYVTDLERTRVGAWTREQAISVRRDGMKHQDRVEIDDRIKK